MSRINFIQKTDIPCYGSDFTLSRIETMFDYIFSETQIGAVKPKISLNRLDGDFDLFGKKIVVLPVKHGDMEVLGFRFGPIAYITDCNSIPEATMNKIKNVPLLVLGAVRLDSHVTHFSLDEAVEVSRKAGAGKTYITHISHLIKHDDISKKLPENVFLAYDGLKETLDG